MGELITIPRTNELIQVQCDQCKGEQLALFISHDFTVLAYRCYSCEHEGYAINKDEEEA